MVDAQLLPAPVAKAASKHQVARRGTMVTQDEEATPLPTATGSDTWDGQRHR
jgi:hypothetical protein